MREQRVSQAPDRQVRVSQGCRGGPSAHAAFCELCPGEKSLSPGHSFVRTEQETQLRPGGKSRQYRHTLLAEDDPALRQRAAGQCDERIHAYHTALRAEPSRRTIGRAPDLSLTGPASGSCIPAGSAHVMCAVRTSAPLPGHHPGSRRCPAPACAPAAHCDPLRFPGVFLWSRPEGAGRRSW